MELGSNLEIDRSSSLNIELSPEDITKFFTIGWTEGYLDGLNIGKGPKLHGRVFVSSLGNPKVGDHAKIKDWLGLNDETSFAIITPAAENLEIYLSIIDEDTLTDFSDMKVDILPEWILVRSGDRLDYSNPQNNMGIEKISINYKMH